MGEHDTGLEHLTLALRLAEQCDDLLGRAHTHRAVASAHGRAERFEPAYEHSAQALSLYRRTGGPYLAHALNGVGWYAANLGRYEEARATLDEALVLARAPEAEVFTEGQVLDSLGYLFNRTGEHHLAVEHYGQAAAISRRLEDLFTAAENEERLGESYAAMGDLEAARRHWQTAVTMYRDQRRAHDCDRLLGLIRGNSA
jgi:tetratricopeptide (TPR) repeat protein